MKTRRRSSRYPGRELATELYRSTKQPKCTDKGSIAVSYANIRISVKLLVRRNINQPDLSRPSLGLTNLQAPLRPSLPSQQKSSSHRIVSQNHYRVAWLKFGVNDSLTLRVAFSSANLNHRTLPPVRAKKTPATLVSEVKNSFDKSTHTLKKVSLRESQKWVERKKYVFVILERIWCHLDFLQNNQIN